MVYYVEREWSPNPNETYGLGRKDQKRGFYRAYVPDELGDKLPVLNEEAQQAALDALTALVRADARLGESSSFLAHLLIRSESISSSWIEGNRVTPKKLAVAEVLGQGTRVVLDVVNNVKATEQAISKLADPDRVITAEDIVDLQYEIEPRLERGIRQEQVFVGGQGYSPLRADFVPPPESEVERLLEDLARFSSATGGNAVVRAAIAHAQFETIHPFDDGNGRTGRALIHTILRRSGATAHVLIPISTVFAGNTNSYIDGLTAFRNDPPDLDAWVIAFSEAVGIASAIALQLAGDVEQLKVDLREGLVNYRNHQRIKPGVPRSDAVVLKILDNLPNEPVLTINSVVERYGVSKPAASKALQELADAKVLKREKDQKGNVTHFVADELLNLTALTERRQRVGGAHTRNLKPRLGPPAPPVQPVQP